MLILLNNFAAMTSLDNLKIGEFNPTESVSPGSNIKHLRSSKADPKSGPRKKKNYSEAEVVKAIEFGRCFLDIMSNFP